MANVRALALASLARVHHGAFATAVLHATIAREQLSAQERSMLTDIVYGTLRLEITLDACLAPLLKRPDKLPAEVRDSLRLASYEILFRETPRHAAVNEWVTLVKRRFRSLAGLVNAVLRRVSVPDNLSPALRYGLPAWLFAEWEALFGAARALNIAIGQSQAETLWLRSYHPQSLASLRAEGCDVRLGALAHSLAVRPSKSLDSLQAFRQGWVQPQNPSSSLAVLLLQPQAEEYVLDLASGNGIKAAQIAASGARVHCVEQQAKKLERAQSNLARLGLQAHFTQHDLRSPADLPPAPKVLLDAPCSGSGTLRSHPELRHKLNPEGIEEAAALQQQLLASAAQLTAPAGRLVYAVCALSAAEGQGAIASFLERQPHFHHEPRDIHAEIATANRNAPLFEGAENERYDEQTLDIDYVATDYGYYIMPFAGMDGFFISSLRRDAST